MRTELPTRASGILLHLSSLPGPYGVGTLGREADRFLEFLAAAGQTVWQMLPVNPIGDGDSPYSTTCSFAGEPLFVDLDALVRDGLLTKGELAKEIADTKEGAAKAQYAKARRQRDKLLRLAASRVGKGDSDIKAFRKRAASWVDDFALFQALSREFDTRDWSQWPESLAKRDPKALKAAATELKDEIDYEIFVQARFDADWRALREKAKGLGIQLMGDLPIFVAHPSSDVWSRQSSFLLDDKGKPTFVAGCPPDAFNQDGQLWGNALYDWDHLQADGYDFWIRRLRRLLELFDSVRLDHFIGFRRYWKIPAKAKTARKGKWTKAPGDEFFAAVSSALGGALPVVAEDLGAVTPEVRALRNKFGFPGMKILQFAFDGSDEGKTHQPHNFSENCVAYPGTHDNDTARGWIDALIERAASPKNKDAQRELADVEAYYGARKDELPTAMIRAAMASRARLCVFPAQDVLGLGGKARMNVPGVGKGNWVWRLRAGELGKEHAAHLARMTKVYGR